tara:strand:+ start:952 stop:1362 length:411 start_codon:yes stop_codon:yes gene_type:complete
MAIPQAETLTKGVINDRNPETGMRENRPETDEELAQRQADYNDWLQNYFINRSNYIQSIGDSILPATDWTQLLDSNLTDESVAEFAAYRKILKELNKDLLDESNNPVDANDEIWDEDYDVHANLPTEPTPVYKPEE